MDNECNEVSINYPPAYVAPVPPRIPTYMEQFQPAAMGLDAVFPSTDPTTQNDGAIVYQPADGNSGIHPCKNGAA
jgi:hypothetical protein